MQLYLFERISLFLAKSILEGISTIYHHTYVISVAGIQLIMVILDSLLICFKYTFVFVPAVYFKFEHSLSKHE